MTNFRHINYSKMLFETLRRYFAVNAAGNMSYPYKYLTCFVAPLAQQFETFEVFRNKENLIASCKWEIGQLTNVLNYLYDIDLKRIYITQSLVSAVSLTMFEYAAIQQAQDFGGSTSLQLREFTDDPNQTIVTIYVPSAIYSTVVSDMTATVNQIKIDGIPYQINSF